MNDFPLAGISHKWFRPPSQRWTNEVFRARVLPFLDAFASEHRQWLSFMEVIERFTTPPLDINVYPDAALQRAGVPTLVITAVHKNGREFEVGVPFAAANDTPPETIDSLLAVVRESIRQAEKEAR